MKQVIYILLLATMKTMTVFAQPIINETDALTSHTGNTYYAEATTFDPGEGGVNKVWDFSQLGIVTAGTSEALPAAGTPYAENYPEAQRCLHYTGSFTENYGYYAVSDSQTELVSLVFSGLGPVDFIDARSLVVFPYSYKTIFTDTYQTTSEATIHQVWAKYDGYGTLKLPFGTYQNVIRQKLIDNGQEDYIWFNVNPFYPLMQTSLADNGIALIKATGSLGTNSFQAGRRLQTTPNPANSFCTISGDWFGSDTILVEIYNTLGKMLSSGRYNVTDSSGIVLPLDDLANGLYICV